MTGATLRDGQADLPSERSTASYWHREPSEKLLGHRTTAELPATADVVIIGSGITGAFAAHFLKEANAASDVLMLEAREACWGATGRNGGHCQPSVYGLSPANGGHCQPSVYGLSTAVARFELNTYAFLRDLVAEHDVPCDWVSFPGVHAFYTPDLFAAAALRIADLGRAHPDLAAKARVVRSAAELAALGVHGAVGAVVQADAASLWPYKLVCWVLERLLAQGAGFNLQTGTAATHLQRLEGPDDNDGGGGETALRWIVHTPRGQVAARKRLLAQGAGFNLQTGTAATHLQRLEGPDDNDGGGGETAHRWIVHTPRGQVAARKVLLACNGHASLLVPAFSDLLVPVRGQVAALVPGPGQRALEHSYVFMGVPPKGPSQDDYLVQRPSGREELILGGGRSRGTARGVGASADDWLDPVVASYLRQTLGATTGIAEGELAATYEWTGIMGYSRDFLPWVGEVPKVLGGDTGLWVAAGYTGHGMPRAALCAKAVVGMMNGQELKVAEAVGLPHEFLVSEERAARAREMDNVTVADLKDMFV
ncbi:hypothetical protein BN1723_001229 [Verticillium longisporum]|uniref:FAD dependent oxidoreductase domain-containing protein n=1 Tax=Verticillium longisporum TaxID=100787 RepID=A0A0G4NKJ3_VERLO|nr:hypothetical protein BN1723_001229 [Verticillium longisporum]